MPGKLSRLYPMISMLSPFPTALDAPQYAVNRHSLALKMHASFQLDCPNNFHFVMGNLKAQASKLGSSGTAIACTFFHEWYANWCRFKLCDGGLAQRAQTSRWSARSSSSR